jgi:hypothetical protein
LYFPSPAHLGDHGYYSTLATSSSKPELVVPYAVVPAHLLPIGATVTVDT